MLLILVPRAGHSGDMHYWYTWASYIFDNGLGNVYQVQGNTYNPLFHYFLWLFGKVMGSTAKIDYYRQYVKAIPLLFDFAGAFWAASLVAEKERRFGLVLLLLLNIGYLYNTLIWVQVDAIYTFFCFGAVVLAAQQRSVLSVMSYVLALAAKTQAIMFLPPLLLLWAPIWWRRPGKLVQAGLAGAALTTLVLAPFIWGAWESALPVIIEFNLSVTQAFPILSANAYNLWFLLGPTPNPTDVADTLPFAGLTYHIWGLLLFCAASALALLPLLLRAGREVLRTRRESALSRLPTPPVAADLGLVLLSCGLIPLAFFFFNTQMHERYGHATILFLAAYGFVRRDYLPYVLASVAYFLNLEGVLRFLALRRYEVLVFRPWFVAALFGLTIFICLVKLYRLTAERLAAENKLTARNDQPLINAAEAAPVR